MTDTDIDLLGLMEVVRAEALPKDWNNQRAAGYRKRAFSRSAFDDAMFDQRAEIGTSTFFKKVYNYFKHNQSVKVERGIRKPEVIVFLHYIFKDIGTPYGWPEVTESFKKYQGGKFYDLIDPFVQDFNGGGKAKKEDLSTGSSYFQLIQMAIELKALQEKTESGKRSAQEENKTLKRKIEAYEAAMGSVREKIAAIETILAGKDGDKEEVLKRLKVIKQKYI